MESKGHDLILRFKTKSIMNTYTVLKESDILKRQEEEISHVSSLLSIPKVAASLLLCHYKWNVSKLQDEWIADEQRVRETVGLSSRSKDFTTCGICFESFPFDQIYPAVCGHHYCVKCWKFYITTSISTTGPGCLSLRCPDPSCHAAIDRDMVEKLASDKDKKKYYSYFIRSYVEENNKIKWCPFPGCENAVEFKLGSSIYEVTCLCSYKFCWNCKKEAHRPVDCGTVDKWMLKNSSEAENIKWILTNTKPCPKCKRAIQKNSGCHHMSCPPPCRFSFCWLCLEAWSDNHNNCHKLEVGRSQGRSNNKDGKRREMAEKSLVRYTHYYERWESNQKSRQNDIQFLKKIQTVYLEKLKNKFKETETKFILEGWRQIIECRRVLKWTYVYGYYLPEHEKAKIELLKHLQTEAEACLGCLYKCAEKDLLDCLTYDVSQAYFRKFLQKMACLTTMTRSYFDNLVSALENGFLSNVNPIVNPDVNPVVTPPNRKGFIFRLIDWCLGHK